MAGTGRAYRHGIVWGDAKPDNIIIDMEDNAWILDFGGGGTPGWMDNDLMDTKEGDLYVVAKMKEELKLVEDSVET